MKIVLSCLLVFCGIIEIFAQPVNFEQVLPLSPSPQIKADFDRVYLSSTLFADLDNDSDNDLVVTGLNAAGLCVSQLYKNDGNGNFAIETSTSLIGVSRSSIACADIDNDGDLDIAITGFTGAGQRIAYLYSNNGMGIFSQVMGTPFDGVYFSSIAFSDINNDGDQDLLITGHNSSNVPIAKLYSNNGSGTFSLVAGTPFTGVYYSSVAFSDIDNDGDKDVMITGLNSSNQKTAKLYSNNGSGTFSLVAGTPFTGVQNSSIAFSDIDGDSDEDLLITGLNSSSQRIAELFSNNGSGNFTLVNSTPFDGVQNSSVAFADIENDGDKDLFISGLNSTGQEISKLFSNDGSGVFTLVSGTPFSGVQNSFISICDVDNDGYDDVFFTGDINNSYRISDLYMNDGFGNYSIVRTPLNGAEWSSVAFSDIDSDGDNDVLITGMNNTLQNPIISQLYSNDGDGNYSLISGTPFDLVYYSSVAFSDIDNDNDNDLLLTGLNGSNQPISKLYSNDGIGNYTYVSGTPFLGVKWSSIAFSDVDSDGDEDVLITGFNSGQGTARLYTNNGSGTFSYVNTPFIGVQRSSVAFSDIDNDGDQDVLITGFNISGQRSANLYTNDSFGNFTLIMNTPFDGVQDGSISFSDVENDGDQDVLITGQNNSNQNIANLYINDGTGNFSIATGTTFVGVNVSSIAFSDVDIDGDKDILLTGYSNSSQRTADIYLNDGSGIFTNSLTNILDKVASSSVKFSDIDNDGDEDLLITGYNSLNLRVAKLYKNLSISCSSNTLIPDNLILSDLIGSCSINMPVSPTATNNCGQIFTGISNLAFPITDTTVNQVEWTFDDGNGTIITQTQNVIWNTVDISTVTTDSSIIANNALANYQWLDCNNNYQEIKGETNQYLYLVLNGNYAVEITQNGCVDTSACTSITWVSIDENSHNTFFSVHPNPSNGKITINTSVDLLFLKLFSISGQLIESKILNSMNNFQFELKGSPGIYLLEISDGFQITTTKLVKE